jgi:phosphatidylserine/phosphatidylglycerophosphate/cardiolipin synthase-like enzyme/uncharacterized membrane protein YdjX (TVP38/TMEM64 family)
MKQTAKATATRKTVERILKEGTNCWQLADAGRLSFLIDAADYFEAFVEAVRRARRTVYIAGWDIDSRLQLTRRDGRIEPSPPLGRFLNETASRVGDLQIYILAWDFPMMYLQERQWLPVVHLGWKTHRRVHFHLDDEHPIGASQHQKLVVIDDAVAFCGGIDLTKNRWDTSEHLPEDPRRVYANGERYGPYHDIQAAVDGNVARKLGDLFRERWRQATGQTLPAPPAVEENPWPEQLKADLADTRVGIARTLPAYKGRREIREVEHLYLEAIRSARQRIYIENQFFTAGRVVKELEKRLQDGAGPEVVLVLTHRSSGWLEQSTMDAIRQRNLQRLRRHDAPGRLNVYHPVTGDRRTSVYVHAKIMVVDDRLAIVGSANLSNRSMGLDSECCLAIEAESDSAVEAAIRGFRHRLLAEHLGASVDEVNASERKQSLAETVQAVGRPDRHLGVLDLDWMPELDGSAVIPDATYLDPERPFRLDQMLDYFTREPEKEKGHTPLYKIGAVLLSLLLLAAAWRWTPLADWLTLERLAGWAGLLENHSLLWMAVVGGFVMGGVVMIPVTLMIGASAVILSPVQGSLCAMAGCVASAWVTYLIGAGLGKNAVRRMAGERLNRLNRYLGQQGLLAVILIRNLPVAPYTIVNLVAGASHIRLRDFLLGTLIGMLPGILAITIFADRVWTVFQNPSWENALVAGGVALVLALGGWWLGKRFQRKARERQQSRPEKSG